ncbi:MAG: hypothetical protein MZV49_07360 [Rhodopseudomonas palustris]|nr:hypothetical protein [Rhodopseudomonas palustris]
MSKIGALALRAALGWSPLANALSEVFEQTTQAIDVGPQLGDGNAA